MRADAVRNREKLVDVAREAFARDGVDSSLEEIARRAGVGIGTLYRRFPTREDLIAAVLAEQYDRIVQLAGEVSREHPPVEAFTIWMGLLLEHMTLYRGLSQAVKEAFHDLTTQLGATCARMIVVGEELLTAAQSTGEVRQDVRFYDVLALMSAIGWAAERRAEKVERGDAGDLDLELLLDIVLRGLGVVR